MNAYLLRRRGARQNRVLCEKHVEAWRALGWDARSVNASYVLGDCEDCDAWPSVLDRVIAAADARSASKESPSPAVLPGQEKLL